MFCILPLRPPDCCWPPHRLLLGAAECNTHSCYLSNASAALRNLLSNGSTNCISRSLTVHGEPSKAIRSGIRLNLMCAERDSETFPRAIIVARVIYKNVIPLKHILSDRTTVMRTVLENQHLVKYNMKAIYGTQWPLMR